jgi:hypothetical protein
VRDLEAYVEGARGAGDVQAIRELLAGLRAGRGALLN